MLYDGQAIIVGFEKFNLSDYTDLKVLGCNATSIEHLPLEECKKRGIKVISLQGETKFLRGITSTAEHTIGLIIALLRNYKTALNGPYKDREEYKGYTLAGKTLGIIGYGRVGKQVEKIEWALGLHTVIYELNMDFKISDWALSLEGLCMSSDIVSLHIPLEGNEGFLTKEIFKLMKPTAYFINTSRSKIVEDGALLWALENKIIAGAAVDFIDDPGLMEYAIKNNNLILTNHIGGCTFEDMERTETFITQKIEDYLKNNNLI